MNYKNELRFRSFVKTALVSLKAISDKDRRDLAFCAYLRTFDRASKNMGVRFNDVLFALDFIDIELHEVN